MVQVTKRIEVDAAHRLPDHQGKCKNYHGHRYAFDVTMEGEVGSDGMVVDFGDIGRTVGLWLDANFDHAMLLRRDDPLVEQMIGMGMKVYLFDQQPTAEVMAQHVLEQWRATLFHKEGFVVRLARVRVWETPTSFAEAS